jgi:hypothetical protein
VHHVTIVDRFGMVTLAWVRVPTLFGESAGQKDSLSCHSAAGMEACTLMGVGTDRGMQ